MLTLILPGYSIHNKDWAEDVAGKLSAGGFRTSVHYWKHWTSGNFSLKYELGKISEAIKIGKVNIIAKSVGTMVAMKVLQKIKPQIGKIILCGIPSTSAVRKRIFLESLKSFKSENIICFQNTHDPFASFKEVKIFLNEINPKIKVVEKSRSDHNYPFFEDFRTFLAG